MGGFPGRAIFNRLTGKGSLALYCILAVLIRFRKNTEKFCDMRISAAVPAA
jgi:hypothetical protein